MEAELWTLLMLDESTQELYYAIAAGGEQDALKDLRVKVGEGVAGWVVEHGETLIVPEAVDDPRVKEEGGAEPRNVRSVIALPLRGRKGTHGAIEIFNPRTDQMTDYTIAFLHILADHAAIAIENAHDVARIQQLTITDDTTGLFNVRHLYNVLGRELERCSRLMQPLSLAFIDLDQFKLVNDAHGHLVGSELLATTGRRLQELSRKQDYCFRYGGDEFVVLCEDLVRVEAAQPLARRLADAVAQPVSTGERLLVVQASIGVVVEQNPATSAEALVERADAEMYRVKPRGR